MTQDNPDTISMEEPTSDWQATQVEDVFLPSVRVQLAWRDVEEAVANGAVVPSEARSLWATWALPGAPTRVVSVSTPEPAYENGGTDSGFASDSIFENTRQGGDSLFREMPALKSGSARGGVLAGLVWMLGGLVAGAGLTWVLTG